MKKPIVVTSSLICIFLTAFLLYLGLNVGLTFLFKTPITLISVLVSTHILAILWSFVILGNKKRRIETRIRWTIYICLVPFFGIVSYLFFGRPYKYKKNKLYKYKNDKHSNFMDIQNSLENLSDLTKQSPQFKRAFISSLKQQNQNIYKNFKVDFLKNGNDYVQTLLSELKKAKRYILINMFIIEESEFLDRVSEILIKKLKEGVEVYIIYDFLGCYNQFRNTKKKLKLAGAKMLGYSPVHFPFIVWKANYRNHRKDIVIDGFYGFVGGINIGDGYCNIGSKFGYWNDSAYKISGEVVKEIENIFIRDWNFYSKKKIDNLFLKTIFHEKIENNPKEFIQVVANGPNHPRSTHLDVLLSLINSAQKSIWIKTPYFIPPPELLDALCLAANSGLDVRLMIPGKTDKFMILDVSKNRTKKLFESKGKIYSLNNTFLHEKTFIFDDSISFVGTTNLDYRALFSDQQTMVLVKSEELNKKLKNKMEHDFNIAYKYSKVPLKHAKPLKRLIIKIFNAIAPIL
ncbi:cardiolipin synthetase [Entomoplasma ellychniae]|uniref:Cardiolipin synthase n=1 Tax=Entomoplasma ellychniae TaxID=2114 RepID=A0A8E2UA28_9MOLU|nr:cardiolipin synthase [Entomoplasma ellychniae]PPE04754.1 cardiolipin synthetase [Entomoplasma ellychniae]